MTITYYHYNFTANPILAGYSAIKDLLNFEGLACIKETRETA